MSIYGITCVELLSNGRIERADIVRPDTGSNSWTGLPASMMANEIAGLIINGDTVFGVFLDENDKAVLDVKFRHVVYSGGVEGIELEDNALGRTVFDLEYRKIE